MKSISFLFLILGVIFLISGYHRNKQICPPTKIEYRYIPRNFYEEQNSENNLSEVYSDMFNKSDVWNKYPVSDTDISGKQNMKNFIDSYYEIK